jgi:hypothetical protein
MSRKDVRTGQFQVAELRSASFRLEYETNIRRPFEMIRRILISVAATLAIGAVLGAIAVGAFSPGPDSADSDSQVPEGMERVLAPIEDAYIEASEGGRFFLLGTAELSSGCSEPAGHEISRGDGTIDVNVYILVPNDGRMCPAIYRTYSLDIDLGTDIRPGREYTVDVNGTLLTLVP